MEVVYVDDDVERKEEGEKKRGGGGVYRKAKVVQTSNPNIPLFSFLSHAARSSAQDISVTLEGL